MSERGLFKRVRAKGDDGGDGEGEDDTAVEKQVVRTVHIAPSFETSARVATPTASRRAIVAAGATMGA